MEKNTVNLNKIGFFRTIKYSITKPKKYRELSKQGAKVAIGFLWIMLVLFALVLSSVSIFFIKKQYEQEIAKIENILPEFLYENNELNAKNNPVEIENTILNNYVDGKIIIDTVAEESTYIEKIKDEKTAVLLKTKIIIIDPEKNTKNEYKYQELLDQYFSDMEITTIDKNYIIEYISDIPYMYYFIQDFTIGFLVYGLIFFMEIIIISIITWLLFKILKIKVLYKEIFSMTIYSFTLPIFIYMIYMIVSYITRINIYYFQPFCALIAILYLLVVINKNFKEFKIANKQK